ncbi:LTA synthase family protein [Marinicella meishanensis]|uniref:LTA synthase family protein n=1 Tax=Marinicella meishanensis TaxID=2873263 RepID=UPI001CC186F1|nr:LTA synthase family protein [Marinicella sp. NBU2979]
MKKTFSWLVLVSLFLLIFAESNYLNNKNILFKDLHLAELILGSLGLALFLVFFPRPKQPMWLRVCITAFKVLLVSTTLFILFVEASIVDFSGMTFGPEVIFHFNWDAFVLGVKEYLLPMFLILLFIALTNWALFIAEGVFTRLQQTVAFFASLVLLLVLFKQTIFGRLYDGYVEYRTLMNVRGVYENEIKDMAFLGINHLATDKSNIAAQATQDKNLIVVYLESFSNAFIGHPKYPGITPKLEAMIDQHGQLSPYIATGNFTMDGLIAAHCGFIPNMLMGNNTLASGEKYYFNIPCFTDVLSKAGYRQEFMGGAKKSFAGKGEFLLDHGYDAVWGHEDYDTSQAENFSWWGLNDDVLFTKAKEKIAELAARPEPFHLSLLTLGTHLKGYPSPGCPVYPHSDDKFIQAIHCTDYLLGSLYQHLKDQNLLSNTTLIITADHTVFNTGYTQDLFGADITSSEIFGMIIDPDHQQPMHPMGLYDLGTTALALLGVEHNVKFILGDAFGGNEQRPLLTRNHLYQGGQLVDLSHDCQFDLNKTIQPKDSIDLCDHRAIVHKLYGYTEKFNVQSGIKFKADFEVAIEFTEDQQKITDITLNANSLKQQFRHQGFTLEPERFIRTGVFIMQFNWARKEISQLILITEPTELVQYFKQRTDQAASGYVLFGIHNEQNQAFMNQLQDLNLSIQCQQPHVCAVNDNDNSRLTIEGSGSQFRIHLTEAAE